MPIMKRVRLGLRFQTTTWAVWAQDTVAKAIELHRQSPFDLVVSRCLPRHGHLAGYWVASRLRIPWVANFNDPWDFSPFVWDEAHRKAWTPDLNWKIWWRRVLGRADAITFPCERMRNWLLQDAPRQTNSLIVPHIGVAATTIRTPSDFVVVHAGKLGVNEVTGRFGTAMFDGMAELFRRRPAARSKTRLVLVGPGDPETARQIADRDLSANVVWTGLMNYEDSLSYVADAAVCVLVEGDFTEGIFLPSKLCDYLIARKPILAFSPEIGTVADMARDGGIRRVSPKDSSGAARALEELFDAFTRSQLNSYAPPETLVRRFEGSTVAQDFVTAVARFTTIRADGNKTVLHERG
jgi:glycosyltransferase involved in cell wall biosynthesis